MSTNQFAMKSAATETIFWEENSLKYLQTISSIFGLAIPNLYTYSGLSVWYILYSLLVITVMCAIFARALMSWINFFRVKVLGTIIVLNCMCLSIILASNVVAILFAVFLKRKAMVKLVKQLKQIDKLTRENKWSFKTTKGFTKIFIALHACILLQVVMEATFYTSAFGLRSLVLALLTGSLMYIHMINVLQISSFPVRVKQRCLGLNEAFRQLTTSSQKATQVQDVNKVLDDTRLLLKIYDSLCDIFDFVSKCYGVQMIFVVSVSVIFIVEGFNTCIKYSLKKIHLVHKENEYPLLFIHLCRCMTFTVRYHLILVAFWWILIVDFVWGHVDLLRTGHRQVKSGQSCVSPIFN